MRFDIDRHNRLKVDGEFYRVSIEQYNRHRSLKLNDCSGIPLNETKATLGKCRSSRGVPPVTVQTRAHARLRVAAGKENVEPD